SRFARTDRRILNQNIVLASDLFEFIEQGRSFFGTFHRWLRFFQPQLPFRPEIALSHVNRLLSASALAQSQLSPRIADASQNQSPNEEIDQQEQNTGDPERHHSLAPGHSQISGPQFLHHFGFPSKRNCAWLFARIRGAAMSNRKFCKPLFFFTFSAN